MRIAGSMPLPVLVLLMVTACAPVGLPGGASRTPPSEAPTEQGIAAEIHRRVVAHRASVGQSPLARDPTLDRLARSHSEQMARGELPFGHDGFEARVESARAALPIAGVSENVAMNGFPPAVVAERVVRGWLGSAGHRRNLEGDFDLTGIGVAISGSGTTFVTQLYARTR